MIERRGIIAGVATLGAMLPGATAAEANPYNHIPDEAARVIRHNAARLTEIGCSAWLLRDVKGEIDGIMTAVHCGLDDARAPRITGSNGQQYIVQAKPIKAQIG